MIKNIPFEIARDIAYFELHKVLTPLNERALRGEFISPSEKMAPLREYERRSFQISESGIEENELKSILDDYTTNPIVEKSDILAEKKNYMIAEIKALLSGSYQPERYIHRLIESYGYNPKQADEIFRSAKDNILGSKEFSLYDRSSELCKHLASKAAF